MITNPTPRNRTPPPVSRGLAIGLAYLLLFAASVPWYLGAGSRPRIWMGLPHWVLLSLAATLAVAAFTVFVVRRFWEDDP